jgi:transcriptional antiterminator NusG
VTDEPNHPIDGPPHGLEGGTVLPPAGETPSPPAVPAETDVGQPHAGQSLTPAETPAPQAVPAAEATPVAEPATAGEGLPSPETTPAPQPAAAAEGSPGSEATGSEATGSEATGSEEPGAPQAAEGGEPAGEQESPPAEPEEESVIAVRRTSPKQAKSGSKKGKGEAKPAAIRAAEPPAEPAVPMPKSENMNWFILKVQSNREDSIREGLLRRVAIAGLDYFFGEVIVPTEKVTEVKQGRKRVTKRKLYPGYLVVQMEINDDTWFLVRETPGIGDFTGAAGAPTPMLPHEVNRILQRSEEKTDQAPKLDIRVHAGDRVKINEGTFENFEGEVDNIDATNGRVTVMINIFGRSTPVELEYWQIEGL